MKRLVPTAMIAALGSIMAAAPAAANITVNVSGPTMDWNTAKTFETSFINSLGSMKQTTEDFEEGFTPGTNQVSFATAVGTFTQEEQGQTSSGSGLLILDEATKPSTFQGRRDMTTESINDGNWLDSNDSKEVSWTIDFDDMITKLGFFLTDVNDVNASMTATFSDGTDSVVENFLGAGGAADNGEIIYVSAMFDQAVTSILFNVNTSNDGWGIDDITVAAVPLPAGVLLLGLGLGGMAAYRRRQAA